MILILKYVMWKVYKILAHNLETTKNWQLQQLIITYFNINIIIL
jgi:hypothetical protein